MSHEKIKSAIRTERRRNDARICNLITECETIKAESVSWLEHKRVRPEVVNHVRATIGRMMLAIHDRMECRAEGIDPEDV